MDIELQENYGRLVSFVDRVQSHLQLPNLSAASSAGSSRERGEGGHSNEGEVAGMANSEEAYRAAFVDAVREAKVRLFRLGRD